MYKSISEMWKAMRRVGAAVAGLSPRTVLLLGWLFVIIYAFPGQMTQDSFDHMREARAGIYSDAHPPIMNVLWKICDFVVAGQPGILLFQNTLLLLGLHAIFRRVFAPVPAAWWTVAVFAAPQVITVMAVIWKDCTMAGLLALGIAGLLSTRRWVRIAGVVALTFAAAFRYNAFGATFPVIVLLFEWRPGMHWLRRYAVAVAVWFASTFGAFGIDAAITDKPMHYWASSIAIYDIVGVYATLDDDLTDDQMRAVLAGTDNTTKENIQATFRAVYTPRDFLPILNDPKYAMWAVPINGYDPAPEAQREAIKRAWLGAITTHPWTYLKHRLAVMAEVLDLRTTRALGAITKREYRWPQHAAEQGLATGVSRLQVKLTRAMHWLSRQTPLFTPWVYLLLTLILIPLAWRQRDALAILMSGVGMEASLFPLVHTRDYRYSHWLVISTMVGLIIVVARRYRAAADRSTAARDRPPGS